MDIVVSAIAGDLISRSATFVINKYFRHQPGIDEILQRLQRVVLRIDTAVKEAEGRHITNQGMLLQLKMLSQGMYRGHYVLDAMRFQDFGEEEKLNLSSSALSKFSPSKRLRFSLEDTMAGMKEFLIFLESYPRILRQPYGTYLLLDNCMFGRQTERQQVLNFLLRPSATPDLDVLPIVGPRRVGKRTLVEYVCREESVRDHFSMILFFPEGSLKDEGVIDWHFFKSIAFGSTNPDEQPKLATMAMEIALEQRQCWPGAHLIAGLLRDNFNARFWHTILECVRAYKKTHLVMFDKHPNLRVRKDEPVYYWRLARSFLVLSMQ